MGKMMFQSPPKTRVLSVAPLPRYRGFADRQVQFPGGFLFHRMQQQLFALLSLATHLGRTANGQGLVKKIVPLLVIKNIQKKKVAKWTNNESYHTQILA